MGVAHSAAEAEVHRQEAGEEADCPLHKMLSPCLEAEEHPRPEARQSFPYLQGQGERMTGTLHIHNLIHQEAAVEVPVDAKVQPQPQYLERNIHLHANHNHDHGSGPTAAGIHGLGVHIRHGGGVRVLSAAKERHRSAEGDDAMVSRRGHHIHCPVRPRYGEEHGRFHLVHRQKVLA